MKKVQGRYQDIKWTVREKDGEWVAESGTGIFVYADNPIKLYAWIDGRETPGQKSSSQCENLDDANDDFSG